MTLVVKIAGPRDLDRTSLLDDLARAARSPGGAIIVHAARDAFTAGEIAMADRAELDRYADDAFSVNRRLVEALLNRGQRPIGISGHDAGILHTRRREGARAIVDGHVRPIDAPWAGKPVRADAILLRRLLAAGLTPIVAPLGAGEHGEMLAVDPDDFGACLARSIGSQTYLILSNVPGLLVDLGDESSVVKEVDPSQLDVVEQFARGRMRRKLLAAREAVDHGVKRVVIGDARSANPVRDALAGKGTVVAPNVARPSAVTVG